jgi:hypothetical protein
VAAGLAVAVAVIGFLVYRTSDLANTSLVTGAVAAVPSPTGAAPQTLTPKWSQPTGPALGAVVSASGVVVTTDAHTVTGRDAVTGSVRWSYTRSNRNLCAVGSADIGPTDMTSSGSVAGIATVYAENGFCSQVMTLDPVTGARGKVRTSPNEVNGSLAFGGPYAGWLGPDRVEVWRYDLVRTIQYGVQVNPPKPGQSRLGCTFTDLALAANQFATVEHCPAEGDNARLVVNFDDPGAVTGHPDGWDIFQHYPRTCVPDAAKKGCADIDTGGTGARIVGITADRVAVLVSGSSPAVKVYDASGKLTSSTPVDVTSAEIIAADSVSHPAQVTPAVQTGSRRYSLIGSHLVAVSMPTVDAVPPATAFTTATATSSSSITNALNPGGTAAKVPVADLKVDWVAAGALGLPATVGDHVLMPTAKGLSTFDSTAGPNDLGNAGIPSIAVDRGLYSGRVDATSVGGMIIEDRGNTVVGLG